MSKRLKRFMKRLYVILVLGLMLPLVASAQGNSSVFRSAEQMPQFPGGEAALMKYIQSHLQYPDSTDAKGHVIVQFVVKADGSIGEVKVVRRVDEALDKEAVRVIKSLPKFTPGRQNGQAVSVWYTLPVSFNCPQGEVRPLVVFDTNHSDEPHDTTIYRSVEQMPQFPGGEAALMKYIQTHINYPEGTDVEGRVIVQFVIKADGRIGEVKVVRSVEESLDNEAVRVVKSLPAFASGRQNGQAVSVWYTLPVSFDKKFSKMFLND